MNRRHLILAGQVVAVAALLAVAAAAVAGWLLTYPMRLAARATLGAPKRKRKRTDWAVVASIAGLALTTLGLRRRDHFKPLYEDDAYLAGVEKGIMSARRSAGFEDGRLSESTLLLERPFP